MQENNINQYQSSIEDEITLKELYNVIIKGKWLLLSVSTSVFIIAIIYTLFLPNIFESKAILVPTDQSNDINGSLQAYRGLAGLAGINLGSQGSGSNSEKAIKKVTSLSFFEDDVMPNIFLPDLMALKYWDPKENKLIYDESIYDSQLNTWVRKYAYPKTQVPSAQESFEVFKRNMKISEDSKTGFFTLTIKHQSPFIAKEWVDLVVRKLNSFYRQKDKEEAQKAVNYLNEQITKTNLSEIKLVIAELLQQETQKLTLIEANEFYVLDYIDPPAVMEMKSEPSRITIWVFFAILGIMLGIVTTLIRFYVFKNS